MLRNSLDVLRVHQGGIAGMFVAVSCLATSFPRLAVAHVISIRRGTAVVDSDHLAVEWKVASEDFVHYYGLGTSPAQPLSCEALRKAAARHAKDLLQGLIIRDTEGNRLSGKAVSQTFKPALSAGLDDESLLSLSIRYVFDYRLTSPPRYLSFQHAPVEGIVGSTTQFRLNVTLAGTDHSKVVQLTNGGNVETLKFEWPNGDDGTPTFIGPIGALQTVLAYLDVGEEDVHVTLEVPLPMLETFLPIDRADRDFLEVSEQKKVTTRLLAFFRNRNPISINGRVAEASRASLVLLYADSLEPDGDAPPTRLSTWMTRVRFTQSYKPASRPEQIELRWHLFNPAVLVADAVVTCGSRRSTHRLSTYEPTLRWSRIATNKNLNGD